MLALRSVTKRYGALTTLNDISLDLAPGEFSALLGAVLAIAISRFNRGKIFE